MISIDFDRVKGYQSRVLLIIIFIIERWFGRSVGPSVRRWKTKILAYVYGETFVT